MFYEIILFGAKSLKKIKKALIKLAPFLLLFTPLFASPEHVNEQNYAAKSWFIFVKIFLAQVWCNYYIVVYSKWKKARFGFSFCEGCKPRHCIIRVITPKLSDQTLEFGNQNLIIWEHEILILNDIFVWRFIDPSSWESWEPFLNLKKRLLKKSLQRLYNISHIICDKKKIL